jgi:ABC-2 type transport system ATP-binding protein
MPKIVEIKNFKMRFGDKTVIEDLSFDVERGQVFGFLGANGSGKTTTIRALLGIYQPTAGQLLINGKAFTPDSGQLLGYLPEERGLYKKESVLDTMVYFGQMKNMSYADAQQQSLGYLKRVGLEDKAKEKLEKLSSGQQQKIQLGVTILNRPELLILDEPTKGFDPINRRLMMDIINERASDGATIVLVTHQMEEVERLCGSIVLLKDGRRRLYGTIKEVKAACGKEHIYLEFTGVFRPDEALYTVIKNSATSLELLPKAGIQPQAIFAALAQQHIPITKFEVRQMSLDDIFVQIYKEPAGAIYA